MARDGRHVPMPVSFARLESDSAIVIAVDLSERQRAEAFLANYQRELEETVAECTRELVESRERSIENERLAAIGTLAAEVAHPVNNPSRAILASAEYSLLCREDEDAVSTFESALGDILVEANRCAQIVRSMLQFSRGQPTTKWVEDLNGVIQRAHRAVFPYAKDRGATIRVVTGGESILARISPIDLEQALVNIMRNAIESREGEVIVSVDLNRKDKAAIIAITNNGRGIEPEHLERLFEPFYSTRTCEGETGLGLPVAHGVVIDHGGHSFIQSTPGIGTRVVTTLPIEASPVSSSERGVNGD